MNLILIFNGWGMDENILNSLLIPEGYEVSVVNFPYDLQKINLSNYKKTIYIGWSFGCYYLAKFILENNIDSRHTIAINGHSETIGRFGIMPRMFDFTLDTLTPETLVKFYKNMDICKDFKLPEREFGDVKYELSFFKENYSPLENIFKFAIVGKGDKIIPSSKQVKYFQNKNVDTKIYEFGHYPFEEKNLLINIVKKVNDEL